MQLSIKSIVDHLLDFGNELVRLIGGYAVILAPVLIPLAPVSIITILLHSVILISIEDWRLRLTISLAIGIALESFALACLIVSRLAEEFNLTREPGEPRLNQRAGSYALTAYIVLGIGMVVVGEILPYYDWLRDAQLARWTLLGFFLLAPFGHWIFATAHNIRRLEARRTERQAAVNAARDEDQRRADQETARREREAAIQEREAQAQAIRERARAEAIEAQARERQAEAEIMRQRAALARAETRKEQLPERSGTIQEHTLPVPGLNQQREQQLARILENAGHDPFGPLDVMEQAGLTRKQFYNLMDYAKGRGKVRQIGRGQYVYANGHSKQGDLP